MVSRAYSLRAMTRIFLGFGLGCAAAAGPVWSQAADSGMRVASAVPSHADGVAVTPAPVAEPVTPVAPTTPMTMALARAEAGDPVLARFYQQRGYQPLWTGAEDAARREAFLTTLLNADDQGLPAPRYGRDRLIAAIRDARTVADLGALDVAMSKSFLQYARDVQTGVLEPSKVDKNLVMKVPLRDPLTVIDGFASSDPVSFLRQLPPQNPEYQVLLKAKRQLEHLVAAGGWGPQVRATSMKPGASGPDVVALRNRLIRMGYLSQTADADYDSLMVAAIKQFQADYGLVEDGEAGAATLAEVNVDVVQRLKSVIVALERERWINMDLGKRYVWVNLADYSAEVIDDGDVTFKTRAVVGKAGADTSSPEFSDNIEYMVVNPSWYVPRSIVVKEYLPAMQRNPNADPQLQLIDASGRVVDRSIVDFAQYTGHTFPYALKQRPSDGNALGLVKFMFPNRYNIYLHDTPLKSLFERQTRDFSHGCIRLQKPFDMAYTLLAPQSSDPKATFQTVLQSGKEDTIMLDQKVPVHLVYFTAFVSRTGTLEYRRDVYGRDAEIFDALSKAGVVLCGVQG